MDDHGPYQPSVGTPESVSVWEPKLPVPECKPMERKVALVDLILTILSTLGA